MSDFIEMKSTDGQTVHIRANAIDAYEVVPASARVDGHIKLYIDGFKFLIQMDQEEFTQKIKEASS